MTDFVIIKSSEESKTCYYPGQRYPPNHENKYELSSKYWFILGMRFAVVLLIEVGFVHIRSNL